VDATHFVAQICHGKDKDIVKKLSELESRGDDVGIFCCWEATPCGFVKLQTASLRATNSTRRVKAVFIFLQQNRKPNNSSPQRTT
jgi:hypothetical protein